VTLDEFWDHIRATRRRDPEAHEQRLVARLAKLVPDECLDFAHHWHAASNNAYRRDLWGAAYLINGGCSDDGFEYFCDWLILQGRKVYDGAVADPDTLAGVDGEGEFEHECNPGLDAWFRATGTERTADGFAAHAAALKRRHPKRPPLPKLGREWDFDDDDEVRKRLPRLAKMYLDRD
jgi:hypothetical protein